MSKLFSILCFKIGSLGNMKIKNWFKCHKMIQLKLQKVLDQNSGWFYLWVKLHHQDMFKLVKELYQWVSSHQISLKEPLHNMIMFNCHQEWCYKNYLPYTSQNVIGTLEGALHH